MCLGPGRTVKDADGAASWRDRPHKPFHRFVARAVPVFLHEVLPDPLHTQTGVELLGDRGFVEALAGHIEIEPRLPVGDLSAGDRARHHSAEQMQARVHAHQAIAPIPINFRQELLANRRERAARRGHMQDIIETVSLASIDDRDGAAVCAF